MIGGAGETGCEQIRGAGWTGCAVIRGAGWTGCAVIRGAGQTGCAVIRGAGQTGCAVVPVRRKKLGFIDEDIQDVLDALAVVLSGFDVISVAV